MAPPTLTIPTGMPEPSAPSLMTPSGANDMMAIDSFLENVQAAMLMHIEDMNKRMLVHIEDLDKRLNDITMQWLHRCKIYNVLALRITSVHSICGSKGWLNQASDRTARELHRGGKVHEARLEVGSGSCVEGTGPERNSKIQERRRGGANTHLRCGRTVVGE